MMTQPLYFRIIDPAQLSHMGLEHHKFGHQSYAQLNVTCLVLRLPMLKVLLKGYKCGICTLANSHTLSISGHSKCIHEHFKPVAHDPDTCTLCHAQAAKLCV